MAYAEGTEVTVERSIAEVKKLLGKFGATHYAYGESPDGEVVQFAIDGRYYRFNVLPVTAAQMRADFLAAAAGEWNAASRADRINWAARAQAEHRRRWRARVLWLKAMLEFTDVVPLTQSLLANLVLPDGRTFGGWANPQVEAMYGEGRMPPLLTEGR